MNLNRLQLLSLKLKEVAVSFVAIEAGMTLGSAPLRLLFAPVAFQTYAQVVWRMA
jgi:hypothetical protein